MVKGKGCFLWDVDGNKYIDYIGSLGCLTLGHCHPKVDEAIRKQLEKGITHSLPTTLECDVAELIREKFPFIESMKFFKTGSEACQSAVTIARAYTNKTCIVSQGYHGHSPMFTSLTKPALGIKDDFGLVKNTPLNQDIVAAHIIEPVELDQTNERKIALKHLSEGKGDALLIHDEIITGGRWPQFSVSKDWGVIPDLICLGKGLANGLPFAVVGGRREVMECGEYFCSGTFNGETLSLAAAQATLTELKNEDIVYLWSCGKYFMDEFNTLDKDVQLVGYPTRCAWKGDPLKRALLWQEALKAGILFGRAFFYNWELIPHADYTLSVCKEVLTRIERGEVKLEGRLPKDGFKD